MRVGLICAARLRASALSLVFFSALVLAGCSSLSDEPDVQPGERPADLNSLEAGIWQTMDRDEQKVATSGRRVDDPELQAYVEEVFCRVAGPYCGEIRIYLLDVPNFNAAMAPNGMMMIWTGTLLRAEDEAQLAYVLGHELGHYLRRHSVQLITELRDTTDAVAFFSIGTAIGGVGFVGTLAQIAAIGSVLSFSRDMEREADEVGFQRLVEAGYDPHAAAESWALVIAEREAGDDSSGSVFFSTHPAPQERMESLTALADQAEAPPEGYRDAHKEFLEIVLPRRGAWLQAELNKRDFDRTQVVLDHLLEAGDNKGELLFYQGELVRIERAEGYAAQAEEHYLAALNEDGAPAETHRSLGLVLWAQDRNAEARTAFESYLAAAPEAEDRAFIESYIAELGGPTS